MRWLTLVFFFSTLGCHFSGQAVDWPAVQDSDTDTDTDVEGDDSPASDDDTAASDDDTGAADDNTEDNTEDDTSEQPENASVVVTSSFPESLVCGEEGTASVELLNDGDTTWSWGSGYKLGTVDDEDPFFAVNRVYLPQGAHVLPGQAWAFEMTLQAPEQEGTYTTDWRMVEEHVQWFGEIAEAEIEVTCPDEDNWEYTDAIADTVLAHATYVRNNYPQFFDLEALDGHTKRSIAYEMMTTVINLLRADGVDASRCIANPGLPQSDPFHWCSDALVVGPPGIGVTLDIYWSWSYPATPQTAMTETDATGVITSDLVALQ